MLKVCEMFFCNHMNVFEKFLNGKRPQDLKRYKAMLLKRVEIIDSLQEKAEACGESNEMEEIRISEEAINA